MTTVGITIDKTDPDYTPLYDILDRLQSWTQHNHVTINTNKTGVMHSHTSPTAILPTALMVGPNSLQVVQSTKLLRVTLDGKLSWNKHVTTTIRAAFCKLFMLSPIKPLGANT